MENVDDDSDWKNGNHLKKENLKTLLEMRAQTAEPMNGFELSKGNFENVNLINDHSKVGFNLTNSNLFKANFKNAHCFRLNLSGSSLMKANFENANMHFANLQGCNLLGINLKNAKLENVLWDKEILQEQKANRAKTHREKIEYYQESEEIYRNLRKITEEDGLFEIAGYFFQKEMQMRRKKLPLFSVRRLFSKIVDFSCGYGERPLRIILLTCLIILMFSIVFFFSGLSYDNAVQSYVHGNSFESNMRIFFNSLYFSIVTFTTTGYGDVLPVGLSKVFAAMEALLGGFILAIFVIVFVKKMTR